jgi:4-aminobutyrate aminotransferase-like enzyme
VLDEIERLDLLNNAAEVGTRLTSLLRDRIDTHEAIGDVRGCGLFLSVELVRSKAGKEPDAELTASLTDRLKDKGFLVSYSGKYNNVLKIRPPLVFSHANADDFVRAFDECMQELFE